VNWIEGDAAQKLQDWQPKSLDFIFVDADKTNYLTYLNLCIPLLSTNGLLLFDNTLWSNRVINLNDRQLDRDTKNMHEFNMHVQQLSEFETVLLPIRDGLTLMRKR